MQAQQQANAQLNQLQQGLQAAQQNALFKSGQLSAVQQQSATKICTKCGVLFLADPTPSDPAGIRTECGKCSSAWLYFQYMNPPLSGNPIPIPKPKLATEVCVAPLVGWRRWTVPMFRDVLLSNNEIEWKPGEKLVATHTPVALAVKCTGDEHCSCGIYAYKTREQAQNEENPPDKTMHIWGEVYLWGRVVEHEKGFRAQFAYPKAFVADSDIARKMREIYQCGLILD
jgi:ribosomal protein S27AE